MEKGEKLRYRPPALVEGRHERVRTVTFLRKGVDKKGREYYVCAGDDGSLVTVMPDWVVDESRPRHRKGGRKVANLEQVQETPALTGQDTPPRKRRGRPPKVLSAPRVEVIAQQETPVRRRGRPPKQQTQVSMQPIRQRRHKAVSPSNTGSVSLSLSGKNVRISSTPGGSIVIEIE